MMTSAKKSTRKGTPTESNGFQLLCTVQRRRWGLKEKPEICDVLTPKLLEESACLNTK